MSCLIAAPCSGSGKTLVSLCLATAARGRGATTQVFKVGPDYLDPQLLGAAAERPCRNLDPVLCGDEWVRRCFQWHGSRADRVIVEGVMGLFDGLGAGSEGSSAAVADLLDLPVVLVVEASRQAGSLAALVRGFRDHGPPQVTLAGVVLNRVAGERHRALLSEALASIGVPLLGVLPNHPTLELPSRHLGLLPPREIEDLATRQDVWAALAEEHLDMERLWSLMAPPPPAAGDRNPISWCLERASGPVPFVPVCTYDSIPVAVATDDAFHFRYPEAGELLQAVGLEPLPWSPLADEPLPARCRVVLLPGGYPELHAPALAASHRSLSQLAGAAASGVPIVAECGGLLLLGKELADPDGETHRMAGVLPFSARRGALSLGYRQAEVVTDGLLVRRGDRLIGHEFHRWQISSCNPSRDATSTTTTAQHGLWSVKGWGVTTRSEGWSGPNIHASWLHLHWAGCPGIPLRLAASAALSMPLPTHTAPPWLGELPLQERGGIPEARW